MATASDALHIGVDGRELVGRPTGVGTYLREVLNAWTGDPTWPHQLTVVVPAAPPPALAAWNSRVRWMIEPAARAGTWWEQRRLPRAIARAGADVLFAPAYTGPLRRSCPMVLTIHDLSYFAHPEWFSWREGVRRRWLTRAAARRAAAVITDSEFVAREVLDRLDVARERLHVIHPGAPGGASPTPGPRDPIVLYVGSLFERRHIPDLVDGFARVASTLPAARLVIVGEDRSRAGANPLALAEARGIRSQVEWHPYIAQDELTRLYQRARVFVFLSDYEGFGMTPLEAMAHGVPPIVLDTPVAREIYADAACYVPADPATIGEAIGQLLQDDRAHGELALGGRRRVAAFSWARAAEAIGRVLEAAARR